MEAETLEDYAFHGNIMELDYHSHLIDSDMVSPDTLQTGHYDYDQVMVAFEHDQHHQSDEQLEIEMLDDYPSNPSEKSAITCPRSSSSSLVLPHPTSHDGLPSYTVSSAPPQTSLVTFATFEPAQHPSPAHLDPPTGLGQPNIKPSHSHLDSQPPPDSSHSSDVQPQGAPAHSHPSVPSLGEKSHQIGLTIDSSSIGEFTESHLTPESQLGAQEVVIDGSDEPQSLTQLPLPTSVSDSALPDTSESPSSPSITSNQNQILVTEQVPSPEEEVNALPENCELAEDQASALVSESLELIEDPSAAQPVWDNPPAEDIPYEDYETESRPRVRTDLLEHVRFQLGSISLNEEGLPIESETDSASAPGVRLVCEGCEYSLFQTIELADPEKSEHSSLDDETVLLSELEYRDLYFGPLEAFIQSLHNIFPNLHDNNRNEIVLNFPTLEFKVPEDNVYTKELSLYDIDRLHIGARLPDRLLISLEKQPRLVHRFNILATYVSELAQNDQYPESNSRELLTQSDSDGLYQDCTTTENEVGLNDDRPDSFELPEPVKGSPAPLVSSNEPDATHSNPDETESLSFGVAIPSKGPELPSSDTRPASDLLSTEPSSSAPPCGSQTADLAAEHSRICEVYLASDCSSSDLPKTEVTASPLHNGASSPIPPIDTSLRPDQLQKMLPSSGHTKTAGEHSNNVGAQGSPKNGGVASALFNPDQVVQCSPEIKLSTESVNDPENQCEEAIADEQASYTSELTIQGDDHLSEGEIEEFVDDSASACADDPPTSLHSGPSVLPDDGTTVLPLVKDTKLSGADHQASSEDYDQDPPPTVSPRLSTCFKRTHEEVEANPESYPVADEIELTSDCLVDAKKPRVL